MIYFQVPPEGEKYIATQEFKASAEDEVAFVKNAVLRVLKKSLDGW